MPFTYREKVLLFSSVLAGMMIILFTFLSPYASFAQSVSVKFSHSGGFYDAPFELALSCDDGYTIHYTTNGNTPRLTDPCYQSPLLLDMRLFSKSNIYTVQTCPDDSWHVPTDIKKCIVIRAAAFDAKGNRVGETVTSSYFIASLGNENKGIPIVSLCTDSLSLFDYDTGIYVRGGTVFNYNQVGRDWERLCNVEFYEPDNSGINQQAGLRIHGHGSRGGMQKGLKLYARQEYGSKRFRHMFFANTDVNSFKHLVLKPVGGGHTLRDHICAHIAKSLNFETLGTRLIILYINGEYWGLYYLKERPDDHYIADHYGCNHNNVNIIESWSGQVAKGDNKNYIQTMEWIIHADLTDNKLYAKVCQLIDIDCFIDYYCFQLFTSNADWPDNNMRCWQANEGKWRWIFFDGDFCLADYRKMLLVTLLNEDNKDVSTLLFTKLLSNEQFRDHFYQRFGTLLTHDLHPKNTQKFFKSSLNEIDKELDNHFQRFGISDKDGFDFQMRFLDEFLSYRMVSAAAMIYQLYYYNGWEYHLSLNRKQVQFTYDPQSQKPTFLFRMAKQFRDWKYVKMYFSYRRHYFVQDIKESKLYRYLKGKKPW